MAKVSSTSKWVIGLLVSASIAVYGYGRLNERVDSIKQVQDQRAPIIERVSDLNAQVTNIDRTTQKLLEGQEKLSNDVSEIKGQLKQRGVGVAVEPTTEPAGGG